MPDLFVSKQLKLPWGICIWILLPTIQTIVTWHISNLTKTSVSAFKIPKYVLGLVIQYVTV